MPLRAKQIAIAEILAYECLDSRGYPSVAVVMKLEDGKRAVENVGQRRLGRTPDKNVGSVTERRRDRDDAVAMAGAGDQNPR